METIFISDFKNEKFISAFKTALEEFSIDLSKLGTYIEEFNAAGNIFAYVLVSEKGESIGMIQFQKTELSNQYITEEYGLIREFWIAPECRNNGFGTILLNKAESFFAKHGVTHILLSALPDAESFYCKNGYTESSDITAFNKLKVFEKRQKFN